MLKDFSQINGLSDCMRACNLNENDWGDCSFVVGRKIIDKPERAIDAFISGGLILSKSDFKKKPTQLMINSEVVDPWSVWNYGIRVVLISGKHRNNAVTVHARKCIENEDGTLILWNDNTII